MIMDGLTELPGFVDFRGCWLVSGCPPVMLQQAWEVWDEGERDPDRMPEGGQAELDELGLGRSDFPHPSRYNKGQVFLVLELGDAGTDIEHYDFREGRECWDVLLGTISALALGEAEARFEHRDLHEGNVCVRRVKEPSDVPNGDSKHRFGYSGLEVTLLDYTLSRATFPTDSGEETLFLDLETNPELFAPDPLLQRQMYRRMKNHVLFNHYGVDHKLTEDEKTSRKNGHKWQMFKPYTNVIWIHYVLEFLIQDFKGPKKELERFKMGVKELREMLSPDVPIEDGGFASAEEVRAFCVEEGLMDDGDGLSIEE
jgi:serine/threonine-protein kinase haspin